METTLSQSIQSDVGKVYGASTLEHKITYDFAEAELSPLLDSMKPDAVLSASIADWGGGNGILSKIFLGQYREKFFPEAIDPIMFVIDADREKLGLGKRHPQNIIPTFADVRTYQMENEFDYSMMRNVMHYMNDEDCIKTLKNIYASTKRGFLFANHIYEEKDTGHVRNFEKSLLSGTKPIRRHYRTGKEMRALLSQAGFATSYFVGKKDSVIPTMAFKDASFRHEGFNYYSFYTERCGVDKIESMPDDIKSWLKGLSIYTTSVYYFEKSK